MKLWPGVAILFLSTVSAQTGTTKTDSTQTCCRSLSSSQLVVACCTRSCELSDSAVLCCRDNVECTSDACNHKCCTDSDCSDNGSSCSKYDTCDNGKCSDCNANGQSCTVSGDCCSDDADTCSESDVCCSSIGRPCSTNVNCCFGLCNSGVCSPPGRPYMLNMEEATVLSSPLHRNASDLGWSTAVTFVQFPENQELREELALIWANDGIGEHASVASFSKLSLQLMTLGAPSSLVRAAHNAALDEIRHAEDCFTLANSYNTKLEEGLIYGPGDFPPHQLELNANLEDLAKASFREGCVHETLAALEVAARSSVCKSPEVMKVLSRIAVDEARHAALGWDTVKWALKTGGEGIRHVIEEELKRIVDPRYIPNPALQCDYTSSSLSDYGVFDPSTKDCISPKLKQEIIVVLANKLLGRHVDDINVDEYERFRKVLEVVAW